MAILKSLAISDFRYPHNFYPYALCDRRRESDIILVDFDGEEPRLRVKFQGDVKQQWKVNYQIWELLTYLDIFGD